MGSLVPEALKFCYTPILIPEILQKQNQNKKIINTKIQNGFS